MAGKSVEQKLQSQSLKGKIYLGIILKKVL